MIRNENEAEDLFFSEIREKKKETRSIKEALKHKRSGKRSILFPSDIMSRKEKLKHTKAGKVMTTNLFDEILNIEAFNTLETHEQKNRLQYWRTKFSNKEILTGMKISNKRFYDLVADLELPKMPRGKAKGEKRTATIKTGTAKKAQETVEIALQSSLELEPAPIQEIIVSGLNLGYNGTYSSEQIIKQFLKFGALLEDEEDLYYIDLKIMQKVK